MDAQPIIASPPVLDIHEDALIVERVNRLFAKILEGTPSLMETESSSVENEVAIKSFYHDCFGYLAAIKTVNRRLHINLDEKRKFLEARKVIVDKLQLSYENLLYKKSHLQREIQRCKDLPTPNLEEISEERGECLGTTTYSDTLQDIHEKTINALEKEREERISTQKTLDGLEKISKDMIAKLDKKRKFLDEVPVKIAAIRATTGDLQAQFEVQYEAIIRENNSVEKEKARSGSLLAADDSASAMSLQDT